MNTTLKASPEKLTAYKPSSKKLAADSLMAKILQHKQKRKL